MPSSSGSVIRYRKARTQGISLSEFDFPAGFRVPPHGHSPPHILVVLRGSLSEVEGDAVIERDEGSVRYSPGHDRHCVRIGVAGVHCLIIEAFGFPELRLTCRVALDAAAVVTEVAALRRALFTSAATSPVAVEEHALALFTRVRETTRKTRVVTNPWLTDVRDHLDQLIPCREPLAEVARIAGRAPSLVARAFRADHGVSIHRYYRRRQVDRAWTLLAGGEESLTGIAAACGFSDQSHLTRSFQRETGESPGKSRLRSPDHWNWYRSIPIEEIAHAHG